jgi:mono/diheme cytochrome c family protein
MQNIKLIFIVSALLLTACVIVVTSAAQDAGRPTNRNSDTRSISGAGAPAQDFSKNTWNLPDDAEKTRNPVASTPESIAKGKELYLEKTKGNCIFCHGETGGGNEANLPRLRRKPADLSNKERMTSMTDGEVFWKISKGIEGIMPAGEKRLNEEERWHVVNYIRTLAKDAK